jgi:nucleoside-diphosphate-sugar epimerase
MDRILITGATGFIGKYIAEYYLRLGKSIRLLVRDNARLSEELKENGEIVRGDVTQPGTLTDAVKGIQAVIHAAGLLGHWGISEEQLLEVNVRGVLNLLTASFDAGVNKFLHLSAGGVTGPVGDHPADETYPPHPQTAYERTKWEGEKQALQWADSHNADLLVVRPTFTYGPCDPHKLPLFKAVKKCRFAFIGNGFSTVHPVYIDDLVRGIDLAFNSNVKGESIILGGPRPVTKRELIYAIADVLGARRPTIRLPTFAAETLATVLEAAAKLLSFSPPLTKSRVLALSRNWGYSISKAKEMLGYQPQVDLQEGLRRTVLWYREHGWL